MFLRECLEKRSWCYLVVMHPHPCKGPCGLLYLGIPATLAPPNTR